MSGIDYRPTRLKQINIRSGGLEVVVNQRPFIKQFN